MFGRLFWTDYLCLDQKNPDEIARQIPRMGSIYSGAEQVVAWIQVPSYIQPDEHQVLLDLLSPGELDRTEYVSPLFQAASAVPLICAEYWSRVWVVQEIALAKRVWVIYGDIRIDFDELQSKLDIFRPVGNQSDSLYYVDGLRGDSHFHSPNLVIEPQGPVLASPMWELCDLRTGDGRIPLWKLLYNFKGHQSSRPADKVYGLLGIIAYNDDGTSPACIENIHVDYAKPLVDIWLDVLYESSPPWEPLREMIFNTLIDTTWRPDRRILRGYVNSSRTSERHKDLAHLTLKVNHALYVAIESLAPPMFVDYSLPSIYSSVIFYLGTDFEPTIQQVAAIYGFSMPTSQRIDTSETSPSGMSSGWQCAAHRHANGKPRGPVETGLQVIESVYPLPHDYLHRIQQACEQLSESCDRSVIIFEIAYIGFCVIVETFDDHSRGIFRLRLEIRQPVGDGKIDM
ncbi:hypothetical protein VSDG_05538 [Cytospora chrysosperma]|uniref:Heterokaryon incompatibility domain-containing protein n=1 Tax=Cytospora chrysosperma TaxID=252740 RepID=A0A423W066_CYTCH|nr:hypothetical protein VSDG_05538 [Valsa sordida]